MSTPLNTIFSWFETGDFPTQAQFQATFSSFFHRDDTIPISKVEGLANMFQGLASSQTLNLHINDADAHANVLAKRDAENITAEHALRWKDKLGITYMATIDSDPEADDGNVYDKEQITAFFATVNQAYTEWGNMIQEIRQALMSNDLNLDELQEIVNYIKENRQQIDDLEEIIMGNTTDDKISLRDEYPELGNPETQQAFNVIIAQTVQDLKDVDNDMVKTINGSSQFAHAFGTNKLIVQVRDSVTGKSMLCEDYVTNTHVQINFLEDLQNPAHVLITKINI
ncbi:hypothetical protein [Chryseobacterium sp.]|uniref:hypothetical protein n=1 Tax=Chryseobacterium sp. TaxID=1871047 RepID=UPI0012A9FF6C|nr:hypothetical protein [Chryseobacterium sp.]QFG53627.1 hypothetical protein F7R58_08710 [Chryseobacterium sp.]